MIDWLRFQKPIIALSPMADMTDSPFCRIAKQFGWPVVFREMVSSEAIVRESEKTMHMAAFHENERPIVQQIFGHDPATMGAAAALIESAHHPDGIDINMGCPVYKIVSDFNGASLMKEPARATAIIKAVCAAVRVPVSVKIRLGWNDPHECLEFIKYVEDAGASLVTIHGRTRAQGYSGVADWEMIGRARERVSIPVLCNGDIHTPEKVFDALRVSGCAGVLIARGALGCPWFYAWYEECARTGHRETTITHARRVEIISAHLALHCAEYGPHGVATFRKHLSWYMKGLDHVRLVREELMRATTEAEVRVILHEMVSHTNKAVDVVAADQSQPVPIPEF